MNETVTKTKSYMHNFGTADYCIFVATLCVSSAIGIYFGIFGKKKTTEEYLLGSRQMQVLPIAVSLIASQFSALSILSLPAEMYAYGTQYWISAPCYVFVILTVNYVYIPVYFNNQLNNCYEYLEARFNKMVRKMITLLFLFQYTFTLPVVIYVPSLAFAQVTGINVHIVNLVVSSVCIAYTVLGGIKAVVWTDVFQALIIFASCLTMIFIGVNRVGGLSEVWRIADEGKRIEFFNMKLDLTTRQTFWNVGIGYAVMSSTFVGLNQSSVQRMIALSSTSKARTALSLYGIGAVLILTMNCFIGIIAYSNYADCDPLKAGVIAKTDQIIPYFVQDIVGNISGLPGLFMSCVLSAALSTMSATMNSLSAIVYFDFIKKLNIIKHNDANAKMTIKVVVVILGIYSIVMGLGVDKFSHMFQVVMTMGGMTHGTIYGVFFLGMLYPFCNSKGAISGTVAGLTIMFIIVMGAQIKVLSGALKYPVLPTSVEGCDATGINISNWTPQIIDVSETITDKTFSIFDIAFPWYALVGAMITIIAGIVVSYFTGGTENDQLHMRLFPPIIQGFLPHRIIKNNIETEVIDKILYENLSK